MAVTDLPGLFKEEKENMNTMRREMDAEKTHMRLLAMNSNLNKCRVYTVRRGVMSALVLSKVCALVLSV